VLVVRDDTGTRTAPIAGFERPLTIPVDADEAHRILTRWVQVRHKGAADLAIGA
jgi:hypothetical protein